MAQPVRLRATVEHIVDHAMGLRSLVLKPERTVPRFRPGQFLQLALDEWDPSRHWPDSRPFSIASPPEDRDRLRITVSEVGHFTGRLMMAEPGATVWLKLPYGEFVVESRPGVPAVLVAGGTGIAPFVSLITSAVPTEGPVILLYGAGRSDLLIYRESMEEASRGQPRFRWNVFAEQGELNGATRGSLSVEGVLEALRPIDNAAQALIYLSGPPGMITNLTAGLCDAGVALDRIRVDAWT